jgi:hypothetical protein
MLTDLERARATIFTKKLIFYIVKLKIIKYIYDAKGRHLNFIKILKILEWESYGDLIKARAFIKIYKYYKI